MYIYNIYIWNSPKRNQPCLVLYWIRAFVGLHVMECSLRSEVPEPHLPRRWCSKHGCIWRFSADQGSRTDFFWGNRRELENILSQNGGDSTFLYTFLIFVSFWVMLIYANLRNRGGLCLAIRQELQEPWIGIFLEVAASCAPRCSPAQNESSSSA